MQPELAVSAPALQVFRKSHFSPAFYFLPPPRRQALKVIYAFCREVDDLVDAPGADPVAAQRQLNAWRQVLSGGEMPAPDPLLWNALKAMLDSFNINGRHLSDLIGGVAMDLAPRRYATFEELESYLYGVASSVGLACLPIFGLDEGRHGPFAVTLGHAVQLTNILRDVGADARRGRVYLPQKDMARFSYTENDLARGVMDHRFQGLMAFEAARARQLYLKALQLLPVESRRPARPALAMAAVYRRLLKVLEKRGFPLTGPRVALSPWDKWSSLLQVFAEEWTN